MYTYSFTGTIHPQRVNFTIGVTLPFILKHNEFGMAGNSFIKIDNSAITVQFESELDYGNNSECNLETLKNIIEENVRLVVDAYCFVKSYSYDVEITKVVCEPLKINYMFGVQGEWNINKDDTTTNQEFIKIINFFDRPERIFLKDVLADFRRAIKYPAMTASFCFRAIETIRKYYFEDSADPDSDRRRKNGWKTLNQKLGLNENDFVEIKKFSLPNRHGEFPAITYKERERIMNFTRQVINGFLKNF